MENRDSTSTIDIDEEWARELENKAIYETQRQVRDQNSTICKVSEILRSVQFEAYEPTIVSLGPYHCHKPHLQATNQLKWLLLNKLLEKGSEESARNYLILFKEKETQARNSYSELPTDMCGKKFIDMMLLDCVFVIMILWFWKEDESGLKAIEMPIFMSGQGSWRIVARDMLLLENQLPFFLLEALFDSAFPNMRGSLKERVVQFFSGFVINNEISRVPDDATRIHHILHLFYLTIVPLNTSIRINPQPDHHRQSTWRMLGWLPSATRLQEAGIRFRKKRNPMNFLDISFKKGVLEIPQIQVDDDYTNILLRNLIALEQCRINGSSAAGNDDDTITAYALFMSCIIDTAADLEILQLKGIIVSRLGNNEQVAQFFNRLCKEVVVDYDRCYISRVVKKVNEHNSGPIGAFKEWRANLNRTYFGDPRTRAMTTLWSMYIALIQLALSIQNRQRG